MSTSSQDHGSKSDSCVDSLLASILNCLIPVISNPSSRVTQKSVSFFSMLRIHSLERLATSQVSMKTAGLILEKSSLWSVSTGKRRSSNRLWNFVHQRNWRGALVSFDTTLIFGRQRSSYLTLFDAKTVTGFRKRISWPSYRSEKDCERSWVRASSEGL